MSNAAKKLARQLMADKKKLSVILCLSAVLMLMWGRLMLKQLPRNAVADPPAETQTETSSTSENTSASARTRGRPAAVTIALSDTLARDLFAFDPAEYVKLSDLGNSGDPTGKSGPKRADEQQRLEDEVRQAAQDLVLQSTILGKNPRAMINGRFLTPGSKINGLELREVLPQEVVLTREGVDVRLSM